MGEGDYGQAVGILVGPALPSTPVILHKLIYLLVSVDSTPDDAPGASAKTHYDADLRAS